jgi:signal transduction histidine kinase
LDLIDNKDNLDKIFITKKTDDKKNVKFKFVQIKIKRIREKGKNLKLIQVIDVSHKILYDETKAEQHFLELINASVSHELRNPLNSMIG